MRTRGPFAIAAALLALAWPGERAARAGSLVIDSADDWGRWTRPQGTVEVTAGGQVVPRYYRRNTNACLDAPDFVWVDKKQQEHVGGVRNAGSNGAVAGNIIDGDPATSWGPLRTDVPESWWVEVDLGRLVTATTLVLRFAEGADPFEEFTVYTSDGTPAFVSSAVADAPDYQTVARVTKPNREMILEYPLRDAYNTELPHRSVRYVYVQMTAWRDPGANPKLAELEVLALGQNLVSGALARGGGITAYSAGGVAATLIDGDGTTFWESSRWYTFPEAHWYFHLNLGARFWVDTIVLISYPPGLLGSDVTPPIHHQLEVSDGTPQPGMAEAWEAKGPYVWAVVDQVTQNPPPGSDRPQFAITTQFEPRQVGRIFYDHLTPQGISPGRIRVREVQAYGEGYVPRAALQSPFLDLGTASSITAVDWSAQTPPGTGVEIRTRTGDEIIEEVRYLTADGLEVADKNNSGTSKDEYDKLPPFRKGEIQTLLKAGAGWSGWSRPYLQPGDAFLSPSPRRYLQVEASLESGEPGSAATLDRIELTYYEPLAQSVNGEIWPTAVGEAAVPQVFSYYILPSFGVRSRGFDEILIQTPSPAELLAVRVGGQPVVPIAVETSADSLRIVMPLVRRQADPLVEVQFACAVFLNGTPFDGFLGLSTAPGARQRVDPGEASPAVDSQRLVVAAPIESRLLAWSAAPQVVFTPNGDGHNDEMVLDFIVYKINTERPLGARIYRLDGGLVRQLREAGLGGRHQVTWDGKDEDGRPVPPGLYVAQVYLESAEPEAVLNRVIAVAY
ncbi:MAG: hypothetical protein ABIL09_07720 [Gemmatimonadota bacterium]